MKICYALILSACTVFPGFSALYAQDSTQSCKVDFPTLAGRYTGECKKGLANGKGEARGIHHYIGSFKNGLPDGKGVYYYSDSIYYSGNFLEGKKEGKGETHYLRNGMPDSLIKGYWSADEYRGNQYTTYAFDGAAMFDTYEISPTPQSGNTVTIEISTTTGSPDGTKGSINSGPGYVLTLTSLISTNGNFIKKLSETATTSRFIVTYELSQFPARLFAMLSNGRSFTLELYKSATWRVRLYVNK